MACWNTGPGRSATETRTNHNTHPPPLKNTHTSSIDTSAFNTHPIFFGPPPRVNIGVNIGVKRGYCYEKKIKKKSAIEPSSDLATHPPLPSSFTLAWLIFFDLLLCCAALPRCPPPVRWPVRFARTSTPPPRELSPSCWCPTGSGHGTTGRLSWLHTSRCRCSALLPAAACGCCLQWCPSFLCVEQLPKGGWLIILGAMF